MAKRLSFKTPEQQEQEENLFIRLYRGELTADEVLELPKGFMPIVNFCLTMRAVIERREKQLNLPLATDNETLILPEDNPEISIPQKRRKH